LDRLDVALDVTDDGDDACRITGVGWVAEEALATALLCALRHAEDPVGGLARAASTSGDSDSLACLSPATEERCKVERALWRGDQPTCPPKRVGSGVGRSDARNGRTA
jgi:ADP-ribosylglycohydrolase